MLAYVYGFIEDVKIFIVGVKSGDNKRNTNCEGKHLGKTDTEARRHRYPTGLDTLVVYAVNDERWVLANGGGLFQPTPRGGRIWSFW